jgi:hypothetical protein
MRSSPVASTGSTGSKTRTEIVDIGRDTGAGGRETEKRKKEGRFRQEREYKQLEGWLWRMVDTANDAMAKLGVNVGVVVCGDCGGSVRVTSK